MNSNIELISIGNELLSGRTLNSHAQTLGAALTAIGLSLARDTTVPDDAGIIQSAVSEALERADIVLVSGGLGPTVDDITREALAGLLDRKIVPSQKALDALHSRFARRGLTVRPVSERMALILEGAETLINPAGAAAAQRLDLPDNKTLFVLPGPPIEFAAVVSDHVAPWLVERFPEAVPLELRVLTTQGIGESDILTLFEAEGFKLPNIAVGFYPGFGKVEIRLTAPPNQLALLDEADRELRRILRDYLPPES